MKNFLYGNPAANEEWKAMEARADALPGDYRTVYREMKSYMWKFTAGDGMDIVAILRDVLEIFENSAANGSSALAVVGEDVASFCDERLPGTTWYVSTWRRSLNRDVARKLAG